MFFLIEKAKIARDPVQDAILLDLLYRYRYEHEYEYLGIEDFYKEIEDAPYSWQRVRKSAEDLSTDI